MPNGQYPPILAGQVITAALLQSMVPTWAYKTLDTSRASTTTLAADPDLSVAVAANAFYFFVCTLNYEGGTQGSSDLKYGFNGPGGMSMVYHLLGITTAVGGTTVGFSRGTAAQALGTTGAGQKWEALMAGTVYTGSAGNLTLTWAQNTSSATPTIVHTGSAMGLLRMA